MAYTEKQLLDIWLQGSAYALKGPLLPLIPPKPLSQSRPLPALPPRRTRTLSPNHLDWRVDTFIVPAAFPRSTKGSTRPHGDENVGQRRLRRSKDDPQQAYGDLISGQLEDMKNPVNINSEKEMKQQEQLYLAVNRYKKDVGSSDEADGPILTVVLGHAHALHKETFEPMISDLLDQLGTSTGPIEFWAIDSVNQGDSAILNENVLGHTCGPLDLGRDILNFIISYLPDPSSPNPMHGILPHLPSTNENANFLDSKPLFPGLTRPASRIHRNRLIIGIGQSISGTGMTVAVSAQPSLFSSIILLDPLLPPESTPVLDAGDPRAVRIALNRRDEWETKELMKRKIMTKPYYRNWDQRCLVLYVEFGTKETTRGSVKLKATPYDEAVGFADLSAVATRRAAGRLALIPTVLPVHIIWADKDRSILKEDLIADTVASLPHATNTRLEGGDHLFAQEQPRETARAIASQLQKVYFKAKRACDCKL